MLGYWIMSAFLTIIALQSSVMRTVQSVHPSTETAEVPEWQTNVVCTVKENIELASSATGATRPELTFTSASQMNVDWVAFHTSIYVNLRKEIGNSAVPFIQLPGSIFTKVAYPGFLCLFTVNVKTGEERIIKLEHYGNLLTNTRLTVKPDIEFTYQKIEEGTTKAAVETFLEECEAKFRTIESAWNTAQAVINTTILMDLEVDKLAVTHNELAVARYLFEECTSGIKKYFLFVALTLTIPEKKEQE